jgi:hypothetical protein
MFRKVPPLEILDQVLRSLKIGSLTEKRWFSKEELTLETLDEWMPLIEPFYLPCKAERYLQGEMTPSRIITVVRHMLKAHKIELKVQERMVNGHKTTLYQVLYDYVDPIVRFD